MCSPRLLSWLLLWAGAACTAWAAQPAADLYVSPAGNDSWSGRLAEPHTGGADGPLATLDHARQAVARLRQADPRRTTPIVISIRGGVFELTEPWRFGPEDSGTEKSPTIYTAYPGETPVISGGRRLRGFVAAGGRAMLEVPEVRQGRWDFCQLWVEGRAEGPALAERRYRPRLPREGYYRIDAALPPSAKAAGKGYDQMQFADRNLDGAWSNLADIEVVAFHPATASRLRLAWIDPAQHTAGFTGPTRALAYWASLAPPQRYFAENVKDALGRPGDWYLDRPTGTLTCVPLPGEDLARAAVIAPALEQLLIVRGEGPDRPVSHLRFEGLTLAYTQWLTPPAGSSLGPGALELPAAVVFENAQECALVRSTIAHTGAWAVEIGPRSRRITLADCTLTDLGAGGIKVGHARMPTDDDDLAAGNTIRNCVIAHGGRLHPGAPGIWLGHTPENTLEHNTVADFYAGGIWVGWQRGYEASGAHDNTLAYNHVRQIGRGVLGNVGGIVTLGPSDGTRLHHNLIEDVTAFGYGGWGLYLDEGTSRLLAEHNIITRTQAGAVHLHYGRDNTLRNNILAFGQQAQLVRTLEENYQCLTFERNIIYFGQGELFGGAWSNGRFVLSGNIYWRTDGRAITGPGGLSFRQWQGLGYDAKSIIADPMFADARGGDFALRPGSPALAAGFQPMDLTGVGSSLPLPSDPGPGLFPPGVSAD